MICPVCKEVLTEEEKRWGCINNHSYDKAKSGYVNLLLNQPNSGDNKQMIDARHKIMSQGHFDEVSREICKLITKYRWSTILDAGCGDGFYSNAIQTTLNLPIVGVDISKAACNVAAKKNKHNTYLVASIAELPFEDQKFDCLLNVFAPLSEAEFYRVSKGYLLKVVPNKYHLKELKEVLYEDVYYKDSSLETNLFEKIEEINIEYIRHVVDLYDLFQMTPYFYTTKVEDSSILEQALDVTFSVKLMVFKKKV